MDPDYLTLCITPGKVSEIVTRGPLYSGSPDFTITDISGAANPYTFSITPYPEAIAPPGKSCTRFAVLVNGANTTTPSTRAIKITHNANGGLNVYNASIPVKFVTAHDPRPYTPQTPVAKTLALRTDIEQELELDIAGFWQIGGATLAEPLGSKWCVVRATQLPGKVRLVVKATRVPFFGMKSPPVLGPGDNTSVTLTSIPDYSGGQYMMQPFPVTYEVC